jgi:RHH-type proline utilization regulon transcriptional repressor/proline dehydrogenase/delta 1-pyrroline-5-carboxylate dehydrogenase
VHAKTRPENLGSFVFDQPLPERSDLQKVMNAHYLADETQCVKALLDANTLDANQRRKIKTSAARLVHTVRAERGKTGGLDAFLHQYDLSSQEGIVLMCLAEALLRVPDADTADQLIRDKLQGGDWKEHLGTSSSMFVNASTWGLMLTGRVLGPAESAIEEPGSVMSRLVSRAGEPVVRAAMRQAMKIMGHQFVMGRTIDDALKRSRDKENAPYRYSFDMLGEAALTMADARVYHAAYARAIDAIGAKAADAESVFQAPGISVKLSALHPRYDVANRGRVMRELVPSLAELAARAKRYDIGFCVDAEEADRLELSLDIFEAVYSSEACADWNGFGLAVQAYQKRAPAVVEWLIDLARRGGRKIPVRLVKGAYWDTEIKHGQELGLPSYPVYTRKVTTDVSYLVCAQRLMASRDHVYPQFATHNAHTVASILEMAGDTRGFEFQRLHGMGEELYSQITLGGDDPRACRVYAPVGQHEDLLPYLVRRLLENGANTSFVNRIVDENAPVEDIVADPFDLLSSLAHKPHPDIPLPQNLFGSARRNSEGRNLADTDYLQSLAGDLADSAVQRFEAPVMVGKDSTMGEAKPIVDPANHQHVVGHTASASEQHVQKAFELAERAQPAWDRAGGPARAEILERAADALEADASTLLALCVREAGKLIGDANDELREAVDFLRYYAAQARDQFGAPVDLPGPTGEHNSLAMAGRGVFVCISPWNFPLAIFVGQVAAALAAGNAVVAKPAEQTPLVAARAVSLLRKAGVPVDVLHFLPGDGATVGATAVAHPATAGVAFTGSTQTARHISLALAQKDGPIATLIAETGGQNAMLVDSSALPEQVVNDVLRSSFNSAGQRCSALRVLMLQEEIAPRIIELLKGAVDELFIGDPALITTDVGPVIDQDALDVLNAHADKLRASGRLILEMELPKACEHGTFFAPIAAEIDSITDLEREVFGPVLHIVRYKSRDLDKMIEAINQTGYGLTLGVHSRIDSRARYIARQVRVGNVYVNRNMVGAVVGVQPFGGRGLSGTGPKAGGPLYLTRFATEKTVSVNTAAVGGNTSLLSLSSVSDGIDNED